MKIGFVNFTPLVYSVQTPYEEPLGGSESGMCYLAEQLAKKGHNITLFIHNKRQFIEKEINHIPIDELKNGAAKQLDYLVLQNTSSHVLELKNQIGKNTKLIYWTGHGSKQNAVSDLINPEYQNAIDKFVFVSKWQQNGYLETFGIDPNKCTILRNGIAPAFENIFKGNKSILSVKENPLSLAYTSTPYTWDLIFFLRYSPKFAKVFPILY
jgi:hypothetical protein